MLRPKGPPRLDCHEGARRLDCVGHGPVDGVWRGQESGHLLSPLILSGLSSLIACPLLRKDRANQGFGLTSCRIDKQGECVAARS